MMGCLYSFLIYIGAAIVITPILFLMSGSGGSAGSTIAGLISLPLIALSLWAGFTISKNKEKSKAKEEELGKSQKEEKERLQRIEEEQKNYLMQLQNICQSTIANYEVLPDLLYTAVKYIDGAQTNFRDNAYVPFWESLEQASIKLGSFTDKIRQIQFNSTRYSELTQNFNSIPPTFPLAKASVQKLDTGKAVSDRMDSLVHAAHRNHDFASIYLQMKTNKILIAGFTSLGQALENMTTEITSSVDTLTDSIEATSSDIRSAVDRVSSQMEQMNSVNRERYAEQRKEAAEAAERVRTTNERLDDLRRGFKPALGSF